MANKNQDWDDLGRSIQDIVDRAVNSRDFQKLNQTVSQAFISPRETAGRFFLPVGRDCDMIPPTGIGRNPT